MKKSIIKVENLVKKYGELTAVNGISFQVHEGEIFGFLGPNGAGKTTTINILCTLTRPTAGQATVNDFDVVSQQRQVRQSIGLVFQDPSLDDRLSALQNLNFHAMVYNVPSEVRLQRVEQVLRMMELWDKRNSVVRNFSGGMKRRLELARGLLHEPKVLFLDEPTLGLDPQTRNRLWEYIIDLKRREGTTIFLTTHYMDEANNADRIGIIDYGNIVALDTPQHLKHLVSRDIIKVKTSDNEQAAREIIERYQAEVRTDHDTIIFEVDNGEEFLPIFIREFGTRIVNISLHHPSLDDVFLKLTGREIREDDGTNGFREMARRRGGRMRH